MELRAVRRGAAGDRGRLARRHGGEARIGQARFPARKTLEEFDFTFQRSVQKTLVLHLGQLDFLHRQGEHRPARARPGPARHTWRSRSGSAPAWPASASPSRPRPNGSPGSADAKRDGRLDDELAGCCRIPLLIVDEVGYIPFDPHAANLMFALVSSRYERASLIVTSNKPFSGWGEIFGDEVVAAAMIDRLVHHAEILSLKGDSYRLKDKDLGPPTRPRLILSASGLRPARRQRPALSDDPLRRAVAVHCQLSAALP